MEWKGAIVGILEMRRHYTNYLKGFPHVKEFRNQLVQMKTVEEIEAVLQQVQQRYTGFEPLRTMATVLEATPRARIHNQGMRRLAHRKPPTAP